MEEGLWMNRVEEGERELKLERTRVGGKGDRKGNCNAIENGSRDMG
jgi:hypothetical protein